MIIETNKKLILASKSPRRQELLKGLGLKFEVKTLDTNESFPEDTPSIQVAGYLADKKAEAFRPMLVDGELLITADTVVILDGELLNKPENPTEAKSMLKMLSSKKHTVMTGVCLMDTANKIVFDESTDVYFNRLEEEEIDYYIKTYKPMDKAGAYGIQEWIGFIGIEKIEGSFYNVMGLPVHKLYAYLKELL